MANNLSILKRIVAIFGKATALLFFPLFVVALLFGALLGGSCARIIPPSGGLKDSLPPRLIQSTPANGALNVRGETTRGRKVVLEFSEPIAVSSLLQQLLISPVADYSYTYRVRGRRLELAFDSAFPANRTLSLNFRNGVQDVTEKNTARDLRIAFATGPLLDTLSLNGTVRLATSGAPLADATVALYLYSDTLSIAKNKPAYATRTDGQGRYTLPNLAAGRYAAAAFTDANGNGRWSGAGELFAFRQEPPIGIDGDSATVQDFVLSRIDDEPPRLERAVVLSPTAMALVLPGLPSTSTVVEVRFNEGLINLMAAIPLDTARRAYRKVNGSIKPEFPLTDTLLRIPTADPARNAFYVFLPRPVTDTIPFRLLATDSAGVVRDTLYRLIPVREQQQPRQTRKQRKAADTAQAPALRPIPDPASGGATALPTPLTLQFPEPVSGPFFPLSIQYDTLPTTRKLLPKGKFNLYGTAYEVPLPAAGGRKNVRVYIPAGSFVSRIAPLDSGGIRASGNIATKGRPSVGDTLNYSIASEEALGLIRGKASAPEGIISTVGSTSSGGRMLLQLLDESQQKVLRTLNLPGPEASFELTGLAPATYFFRLLLDLNGNGRYDAGSYRLRRQPEPMLAPVGPVQVKANWEVEGVEVK
jgi:uncharacterized protein (DUF2141 family)